MRKFSTYASMLFILLFTAACNNEKDLYQPPTEEGEMEEANTFDFSTVREVNLNVNYQLGDIPFSVAFEVYAENPVNEVKDEEGNVIGYTQKENVQPLYWDYTKKDGTFSKQGIELPAYAETLYILSRNPLANPLVMTATLDGNTATATAPADKSVKSAKQTRAEERLTDQLPENLWKKRSWGWGWSNNLRGFLNEWKTLGQFGEQSGRPAYLLDRDDPNNARLVFTKEEMTGLFEEIGKAINIDNTCPEEYRMEGDLTLVKDSEVAITMLGGNTCWNSTLGYYYYTENNKPNSLQEAHIICIYPNTQDGEWDLGYSNAVGLKRGDVVQLMYYPDIQNNGNMSGATKEFPRGTKIGFVLKNNGWGAQGDIKYASYGNRSWWTHTNNFWACSTDGLSDVKDAYNPWDNNNLGTETRTAKFQYVSGENKYAIVTFEDFGNDTNFSDVSFSLKPASAFQKLPEVISEETKTCGIYAFEDLWPAKGDYDMNDVVVKYTYANIKERYNNESEDKYKIKQESMTFKTFQNYATKDNGLAFKLENAEGYDECRMEIKTAQDADFKPTTFAEKTDTDGKKVFTLTDNVKTNMGAEYKITLIYNEGKNVSEHVNGVAKVKPFIFRTESKGRIEVHISYEAPTSEASDYYFGKEDDKSDKDKNIYYVRSGNYPFAFYLAGATEEDIQPLLNRENESKGIDALYPEFLGWSESKGSTNQDWYKHPQP